MAIAGVLPLDDIPTPLALVPEAEATDASQHDWRLSLVDLSSTIIADRIAPVDPVLGVPYLVAVTTEITPDNATRHHPWGISKETSYFKTLAGAALKGSILQMLPRELHYIGPKSFHRRGLRPRLPSQVDDVHSRVVVAYSGAFPDRVIDVSGDQPVARDMTAAELEFFETPYPITPFGRRHIRHSGDPVRNFLEAYARSKKFGQEYRGNVDEFLRTHSLSAKRELGHLLLMTSAEATTEQVRLTHGLVERAEALA